MRKFLVSIAMACMLVAICASAALAREPATPEITYQQAVEQTIAHSKSLKNAELDVDRAYEMRQFSFDDVKYVPMGTTSTKAEQDFTSFVMSDINWQSAKKTLASTEDAITTSVYQAYYSILQGQEKLTLAELELKDTQEKLRIANVGFRVGTVNQTGLVQAEAARAGADSSLLAARKALDDAYQKFNLLVGLWPDDRPVLVDRPELKPLVVDNLDTAVQRALETSPSIWLAQQKIDYANVKLDLYFGGGQVSEPYEAKEIDIDKAETSYAESQEKMKKLVQTLYYTTMQKEEQYNGLLESKKVAEETLRVTRVKLDVGMATKAELIAAELAVAQADKSIFDAICDHELLVMYFHKPWTYA